MNAPEMRFAAVACGLHERAHHRGRTEAWRAGQGRNTRLQVELLWSVYGGTYACTHARGSRRRTHAARITCFVRALRCCSCCSCCSCRCSCCCCCCCRCRCGRAPSSTPRCSGCTWLRMRVRMYSTCKLWHRTARDAAIHLRTTHKQTMENAVYASRPRLCSAFLSSLHQSPGSFSRTIFPYCCLRTCLDMRWCLSGLSSVWKRGRGSSGAS
jgi:hypothetical protein